MGKTSYRSNCIVAVIIMLFQSMMIVTYFTRGVRLQDQTRARTYLVLYIVLFTVTFFFLLASVLVHRGEKPGWERRFLIMQGMYAVLICVWSSCVTRMDQYSGNSLSVFSYVSLSVAALTVLRPWQSIAVYTGNFCLLTVLLQVGLQNPKNTFSNVVNSFFLTVLAIMISIYIYKLRVSSIRDKHTVEAQYGEIRQLNEKLRMQSLTDELTGLNNRRFVEDLSEQPVWIQARSISGLMMDIDFFKQYNDAYGHLEGDECLRNLAKILADFVLRHDAHAVRYGGEEFFLFLFNCPNEEAVRLAEALRTQVWDYGLRRADVPQGRLTVSIGVCTIEKEPGRKLEFKALVEGADKALYEAKRGGRNRVSDGCTATV